jgi:hypothetical protein
MSIATSTAIGIAGVVGGIGAIGGAAIGSSAAGNAASTQADAAKSAAQLQHEDAQAALQFQENQWNTQQANEAPWLSAGKGALGTLQDILAQPGQGWNETFTPPTAAEAAAYPGYQFQEQQGEEALQNSAAAKGALYSGNTQEALARYGQQSAQSDYTNVYDQAFQQYQQKYGEYGNQLNRLSALAGVGQMAANSLGQQGQGASGNVGNILLTSGAQQGQDIQNAAAAEASGYVGSANAWSGALGGGSSNIMNLLMMQQILGGGLPSTAGAYAPGPGNLDTWSLICWVAAELYGGWEAPETHAIRRWLLDTPSMAPFVASYRRHGKEWAESIRKDLSLRARARRLFDSFLGEALAG